MQHLLQWPRTTTQAWTDAVASVTGLADARPAPRLAPTPRATVSREGTASLYRFVRPATAPASPATPLLLVPSMINRWYVLDLRPGASLVEALVDAGIDTWCLDWGVPEDEDRYLSWTDVLDRLRRMVRRVRRETGADKVAILGYCMGGTLSAIHTALHPRDVAALVNLAGPIDFSKAGMLGRMVERRWFDADAIADAGSVSPDQMQAGFVALRPTLDIAKYVGMPELMADPAAMLAFRALDTWASDNIPFPGEAYRTYIKDLYQANGLIQRTHRVRDRLVDLSKITCPTAAVVASRDTICPSEAACALLDQVGTRDTTTLRVAGGHVGAVVGTRAARDMYPALIAWLAARL